MKNINQYIGYFFMRIIVAIFSVIPFKLLYAKANFVKFILQKLMKYRRKVVRENLESCFPKKSEKEIKALENGFYSNLADIFVESIKCFSMKQKDFSERYRLVNPEIADKHYEQGKDIIILAAHYTNWEWGHGVFSPPFQYKGVVLYRPLKNKYLDEYVKRHRAAFNSDLVSVKKTWEYFRNKSDQPAAYVLGADQSPSNLKKSYIANFFGRKTYFLHGPEGYAKFLNAPVYYLYIRRVKKGFYETELELLCESPKALNDGEITQMYADSIEKNVLEKPENWLWSHKRWKHKVPE